MKQTELIRGVPHNSRNKIQQIFFKIQQQVLAKRLVEFTSEHFIWKPIFFKMK